MLDKEGIEKFLSLLGSQTIKPRGGWVSASCVFAKWKHVKGTDSNPSFGVRVKDNFAHCWSCGVAGDLEDVLMEMRSLLNGSPVPGIDLKAAAKLLYSDNSELSLSILPYDSSKKPQIDSYPFSERWLSTFTPAYNHAYLKSRKVPEKVAKQLDIRFDSTRNRICFPIRSYKKTLMGLHGRSIVPHPLRYFSYDYKGNRNPWVWHNENGVDWLKPVVLCEGPFDTASVMRVYPNVMSSLSASMNQRKLKRLLNCVRVVTFFDNGTGGNQARQTVDSFLAKSDISVVHLFPKGAKDPGDMSEMEIAEVLTTVGI